MAYGAGRVGVLRGPQAVGPGRTAPHVNNAAALHSAPPHANTVALPLFPRPQGRRTAEQHAEGLKVSWQCRVCLAAEVDSAFTACGHLLCDACARALPRRNQCPFCRKAGPCIRIYK